LKKYESAASLAEVLITNNNITVRSVAELIIPADRAMHTGWINMDDGDQPEA
jgi:hypothetical protein